MPPGPNDILLPQDAEGKCESPTGRYVYTIVPPNMQGTTLYSLSGLKKAHPEEAAKALEKYQARTLPGGRRTLDRLRILETKVEPLGGKWSDAIFLSETDPTRFGTEMCREIRHIKLAMAKSPEETAGVEHDMRRRVALMESDRYYRIPVEALADRTVVRATFPDSYTPAFTLAGQDSFTPGGLSVSPQQKRAWKEDIEANRGIILYSRTPHLLVAAVPEENNLNGLDIAGFKIISPQIDRGRVFDSARDDSMAR